MTRLYSENVRAFGDAMRKRLVANRDKGGWNGCSLTYLFRRLEEEVQELKRELETTETSMERIEEEAADVANFAMMIFEEAYHAPS